VTTSDLRGQLQSALGATYTLERELGGGGMSRVFVAEEAALGRKVVVKVLPPELAAEVSAERFTREIRVAASLQHPNIVPVLSTGVADGVPYYTMPFVRGESLRARLGQGALPSGEAVSVLRDVARALAHAHVEGIVHRDIKPENVLLSGGAAVVTDFGIAKAVSASRTAAGGTLTSAGAALGTPAYMAPEQALGDEVDAQADLYAWGVMAYEVLAGTHPFADRTTAQQLVAAHLSESPTPLAMRNAGVPPNISGMIMRCLEKRPSDRPGSARDVLAALEGVTPIEGSIRVRRSTRRWAVAALVLVALGGAAALVLRRGTTPIDAGPPSIAVLPLLNAAGDTADEYLSDGLTDELTTALSRMSGLRVAARSSAYRYKGRRAIDVRAVGETLGVGAVLQGTLRRSGGRVRVSAQLADARSGVELWADAFDRTEGEAFAVQGDLARAIAAALRVRLQGDGLDAQRVRPPDPTAYDLYLRGRFLLNRGSRADMQQAIALFAQAGARDSMFAEPHAAASTAWWLLADAYLPPLDAYPKMEASAKRALALDDRDAEAHSNLGSALAMLRSDWGGARREFERAVELSPGDASALGNLALFWIAHGDRRRCLSLIQDAARREPFSPYVLALLVNAWRAVGESDSAFATHERLREIAPTYTYGAVSDISPVMRDRGRFREALVEDERVARAYGRPNEGLVADLAGLGRRAEAEQAFDRMKAFAAKEYLAPEALATAALALGRRDEALQWIERGVDLHSFWGAVTSFLFPELPRAFAEDPRYKTLRSRIGLP
jgi:serine/threonine-protein kinase